MNVKKVLIFIVTMQEMVISSIFIQMMAVKL